MPDRNEFADVQQFMDRIKSILDEYGLDAADADRAAIAVVADDPGPRGNILPAYSAALDSIYNLRVALAYEARVQEVHLGYASFPKGRRDAAERSVERMRAATHEFHGDFDVFGEDAAYEDLNTPAQQRIDVIAATLMKHGLNHDYAYTAAQDIVEVDPVEQMSHALAAEKEVHALRGILAVEAAVIEWHLTYKSFPKSRRGIAEEQVTRMREAAVGGFSRAYAGHFMTQAIPGILRDAGAPDLLTRNMWEKDRATI